MDLYREGVVVFHDHVAGADPDAPACGSWTAGELIRHGAAVAAWYHQWLDRALAGDAEPPFTLADLPTRNAAELESRADQDPDAALAEFVDSAGRYADRLVDHWDVAYGYPGGTVTAGLHAAVAAAEWHLHTWDLARAAGGGRPGPGRPSGGDDEAVGADGAGLGSATQARDESWLRWHHRPTSSWSRRPAGCSVTPGPLG
jgi:uncharacterized protein (TIGR03083 family)